MDIEKNIDSLQKQIETAKLWLESMDPCGPLLLEHASKSACEMAGDLLLSAARSWSELGFKKEAVDVYKLAAHIYGITGHKYKEEKTELELKLCVENEYI